MDDETPQADEPIAIILHAQGAYLALTIEEADELRAALERAVNDARMWLEME